MSDLLADTHAAIWYLFEPSQLSSAADTTLSDTVQSGAVVYVSAISVIEVRYLVEKGKLPETLYEDLVTAIHDPDVPVKLLPIDWNVVHAVERIPRDIVPDLPDRIIAATALAHSLTLVTADHRIQASQVPTIW